LMGKRRSGENIHGVILLDKPVGLSSNQALQRVRRLMNARKGGHTGSLDPFATGMLPICLGEASKTAAFMLEASKVYRAVAQLGKATSSGDIEGEVIQEREVPDLDVRQISAVLGSFVGVIEQVPPMYSALKHAGQPLYKLARQGISVERKARQVTIFQLGLVSWQPPFLAFETSCSKGTYVRTLAEDICIALGSCGHLQALRRLSVEPFSQDGLVSMQEIEQAAAQGTAHDLLLPLDAGLQSWPALELGLELAHRFCHGNPVAVGAVGGRVRVFGLGRILGLGEVREDGLLHPDRVFVLE
jgi:tRNA pseudouridine55 synthase